jgi:hypothetical protein
MTDKPEVKAVFAEVRRPRGTDPGAAVEGRYVVEDGVVTLTTQDGIPVRDEYGKLYKHTLVTGDIPKQIAAKLRGKDGGRLAGFEPGPLRYPPIKVV